MNGAAAPFFLSHALIPGFFTALMTITCHSALQLSYSFLKFFLILKTWSLKKLRLKVSF